MSKAILFNQRIIQRTRQAWALACRAVGAQRRRARAEDERMKAELELIADDIVAEGIETDSPLFWLTFNRIIQARALTAEQRAREPLLEDWPDRNERTKLF